MPLLNKIIEFVLYEHPIDIEKLRRSLHHQVTANMDFLLNIFLWGRGEMSLAYFAGFF